MQSIHMLPARQQQMQQGGVPGQSGQPQQMYMVPSKVQTRVARSDNESTASIGQMAVNP